MHEDDGQRDTPDTMRMLMEQTAPQTIVEHFENCVANAAGL